MTDIEELEERTKNGDIVAMANLAFAYEHGLNVEENAAIAQQWYDKLISILLEQAEAGDQRAMWNLAFAYRHGYGVEVNPAKAKEWTEKYHEVREHAG